MSWEQEPYDEKTAQRIRDLIRAAPPDWPGAPIRWVRLREQATLTTMIANGEVEAVETQRVDRPTNAATYIRFTQKP